MERPVAGGISGADVHPHGSDGILYVPGFNASTAFCAEDFSYRCKMKWSYSDYERVLREYREIVAMLNALRAKEDRLGSPLAEQLDVLNEAERRFWNTYLRPFSNADDWESGIADISECVDIVDDVRILSEKRGKGESLTDVERSYLRDYLDVSVSPEEKKALQRFYDIRIREAEQRVGSNIDAYNLIVRVRRVNMLQKLAAPQIIIERESAALIETLALHRCGVRAEKTSPTLSVCAASCRTIFPTMCSTLTPTASTSTPAKAWRRFLSICC